MDDNLENMLNEVPWLRAEPMAMPRVTDNAKNEPQATDSKKTRFFQNKRKKVGIVGTIAAVIGLAAGCQTPTDPIDHNTYVDARLRAPEQVLYTEIMGMGGGPVINHVLNPVNNPVIKIEGNGKTFDNLSLGQEVNFGSVKKNTLINYTTTITGDSGNVFRSVIYDSFTATGNVIITPKIDVLDTRTFDAYTVSHWLLLDQNTNWRWDFKDAGQTYGTLDLSFNPDARGTGARLSDSEIFMTENTLEAIASHSKGKMAFDKIQNSNRNGDYTPGQPANGQFRTFYDSDPTTGVANIVYPSPGDRVMSSVMLVNPAHSGVEELPGEIVDALYQGNENVSFDSAPGVNIQYFTINGQTYKLRVNKGRVEQFNLMLQNDLTKLMANSNQSQQVLSMLPSNDLWAAIEVTYSRPAGSDSNYKFYMDREERTGWPTSTTMTTSTTSTMSTSYGGYSSPTDTGGSSVGPQSQNATMRRDASQTKRNLSERIREKH